MDGSHDSSMMTGATEPAPAPDGGAELVAAVNEQVLPQLSHLAHGPLAVGTVQALAAAMDRNEAVTAVVLQVRVRVGERLFTLAVQVVVSP